MRGLVSNRLLAVLTTSMVVLGQDLTARQSPRPEADGAAAAGDDLSRHGAPLPKKVYAVPPGPWGALEYYYTYLYASAEQVEAMEHPSAKTTWVFRAATDSDLRKAIEGIFPGRDLGWLRDRGRIQKGEAQNHHVYPPEAFCRDMTAHERSALAQVLRAWPENPSYANPMVIESGDPVAWLTDAGLRKPLVELMSSLCYRIGSSLLFSDVPLVMSEVKGRDEEKSILRALTRTRTLVLRLNVDRSQDLRGLERYWSNGNRKALYPILESVLETPGVERLDVAHLLPPLPRMLLYTYPGENMGVLGLYPDCHWTSLNFFRRQPDARFLNDGALAAELAEHYTTATPPLRLGDILVLVPSGSKRALHSCVYIAGDIVFTKNGMGLTSPWIFMRLDDVRARYERFGALETVAYRRID